MATEVLVLEAAMSAGTNTIEVFQAAYLFRGDDP